MTSSNEMILNFYSNILGDWVSLTLFSASSLQYSLCNEPLIELSNPGASGSVFYLTKDDEFIIKTVMHKEAEFLQKLLPGYYMVRLNSIVSLLYYGVILVKEGLNLVRVITPQKKRKSHLDAPFALLAQGN